jgi:hypothetical protein
MKTMAQQSKTFVDSSQYVLRRDYAASARLNLQHYQHKQCLGYLLHPSIQIKPGMKIADVATGTGTWLLDLSDEVPEHCLLEGWDISNAQFPHKSSLPANVKFGVFDATAGIPKDLVEKYDVVHVGLLALVVKGDPAEWIQNLMRLLSKCSKACDSLFSEQYNTDIKCDRTRRSSSMDGRRYAALYPPYRESRI